MLLAASRVTPELGESIVLNMLPTAYTNKVHSTDLKPKCGNWICDKKADEFTKMNELIFVMCAECAENRCSRTPSFDRGPIEKYPIDIDGLTDCYYCNTAIPHLQLDKIEPHFRDFWNWGNILNSVYWDTEYNKFISLCDDCLLSIQRRVEYGLYWGHVTCYRKSDIFFFGLKPVK